MLSDSPRSSCLSAVCVFLARLSILSLPVPQPSPALSSPPFVSSPSLHRITFCHLPFQSKWLYIGTERGNIHIVNVESFTLSGYVIMWNKAIEL